MKRNFVDVPSAFTGVPALELIMASIQHQLDPRFNLSRKSVEIIEPWGLLIKTLLAAAMIVDSEGCVNAVNPAFVDLFGLEKSNPEEIDLGKLFQVPPEQLLGGYLRRGMMAVPFGDPVQYMAIKRSGEKFLAEITILPVMGKEIFYLSLIRRVKHSRPDSNQTLSVVAKRVIEVQEEERRRIARDLHDETMQQFFISKIQLQSLMAKGPEALYTGVPWIIAGLDTAQQDFRRIIMDLHPKVLDDFGLCKALEIFVKQTEKRAGLKIDCKLLEDTPQHRFSRDVEASVYRIVQAALNNIVKHSKATSVLLRMCMTEPGLIIIVQDDGVGFDPKEVEGYNKFGLSGMRERAAVLGGSVEIKSSIGKGTTVIVELPFKWSNK